MVKPLLLALSVSLVYLFVNTTHPLALGLVLLLQTICIALLSGLATQTFWLSYVLFLVLLGGMLVLFLYVTSLASNEMFSPSPSLVGTTLVIFSLVVWGAVTFNALSQTSFSWEPFDLSAPTLNLPPLASLLVVFYSPPTMGVTLGLAWYLLLALLVVVKLINASAGPLRPHL